MTQIRVSQHSGRAGKAKHNDRQFDLTKAGHIDPRRSAGNGYWCIYDGMTFDEAEKTFYQNHFAEYIDARNARYIEQHHPEKCKTINQLLHGKQTQPEELILQIGKCSDSVADETYRSCLNDYIHALEDWNDQHGRPFTILDVALHYDETTPHMHLRRVWSYTDNHGCERPGQNKALERAGVPLPDPGKQQGRYNNRKITFDRMMRDKWIEICQSHGLAVNTVPQQTHQKHLAKEQYIDSQIIAKERQLQELVSVVDQDIAEKLPDGVKRTITGDYRVSAGQMVKLLKCAEIASQTQSKLQSIEAVKSQVSDLEVTVSTTVQQLNGLMRQAYDLQQQLKAAIHAVSEERVRESFEKHCDELDSSYKRLSHTAQDAEHKIEQPVRQVKRDLSDLER